MKLDDKANNIWSVMKEKLPRLEEMSIGDSIRTNHTECPAGEDTRQRLYIERKPSCFVGFCHNCQEGNVLRIGKQDMYREPPTKNIIRSGGGPPTGLICPLDTIRQDSQGKSSEILGKVMSFMPNYNASLFLLGFGYDTSTHRFCMPTWQTMLFVKSKRNWAALGKQGHVLRRLKGGGGPKYIKVDYEPREMHGTFVQTKPYQGDKKRVGFLVEDLLSGMALAEACPNDIGLQVGVLHGLNLDPVHLHRAFQGCDSILVWLDNDNPHVKEQAHKAHSVLKLLFPTAVVDRMLAQCDPKNQSEEELKNRIQKTAELSK